MQQDKPRSVLGIVFLTVFLDLVGFSILFPLFPELLRYYVELEGPGSLVGRLQHYLEGFAAGHAPEIAVVTLFGGVLGSLYSVLQFLFAPVWGHLSDRYGRRRILLITLTGTALSHLLWVFAGRFIGLVAARLLGGIMAGNISIASAAVADTTEGRKRAHGMGIVGMAIGLGFVIGPAIGGMTAHIDLAGGTGGGWFGLHPFSAAALAAFSLALFNVLWGLVRFPETYVPGRSETIDPRRSRHPLKAIAGLPFPGVRRTNLLFLLYQTAFAAMEFTLVFLAFERFDYTARENAWMFVFVGLAIALVQGGLVRRVVPRFGERRVAIGGLVLLVPGLAFVGLAGTQLVLYAGLLLMSVGSALTMPSLSALISRYVPADVQGVVLGSFRSCGALSRAIGPILGGLVYWRFGATAPYLAGAMFLLVPILLALGLPAPPPDPERPPTSPTSDGIPSPRPTEGS